MDPFLSAERFFLRFVFFFSLLLGCDQSDKSAHIYLTLTWIFKKDKNHPLFRHPIGPCWSLSTRRFFFSSFGQVVGIFLNFCPFGLPFLWSNISFLNKKRKKNLNGSENDSESDRKKVKLAEPMGKSLEKTCTKFIHFFDLPSCSDFLFFFTDFQFYFPIF